MPNESIIDEIYESAFAPEHWPEVLDKLAQIVDARGGVFFAANGRVLNWTVSPILRADFTKYVMDGLLVRCERRAKWFSSAHAGFLVEQDLWKVEELDQIPIYRDFLRPRGLGWAAATAICLPTGDQLVLSLERDYARGPIERATVQRLDELRPHLIRSALISARLQLERAQATGETLAALGLPALILNCEGKVLGANNLIKPSRSHITWEPGGRVSISDCAADRLFQAAIATIEDDSGRAVRSFPIRDTDGGPAMVAHVVPVRLSARDIFRRSVAVLILTPMAAPNAPPIELLQSLFDLTPAESRIARGFASGATIDDVSETSGISRNTVRAHLRSIMDQGRFSGRWTSRRGFRNPIPCEPAATGNDGSLRIEFRVRQWRRRLPQSLALMFFNSLLAGC